MEDVQVVEVNGEYVTYTISDIEKDSDPIACAFVICVGGDITLVNHFSGKSLWVAAALDPATSFYDAMMRTIEVARELKFLGDPA